MGEPYRPNGVASDRAREALNQLAAVQIDRHHAHAETDLPTGKLHMDDDHHPWQKEERS